MDGSTQIVVPVTGLTPYLRLRISTDDDALTLQDGRSFLVFLPLPRRRVVIPLEELGSSRIGRYVRWDCVAAIALIVTWLVLGEVPVIAAIPSIVVAVALSPFLVTRAVRIRRLGGQESTYVFCWRYDFDVSLALLDAERRRDAARSAGREHTGAGRALLS